MLRERINKGNIYTCEKHYKIEDFEFTPTGRKKGKIVCYAIDKSSDEIT